jgi:hypothetical protein
VREKKASLETFPHSAGRKKRRWKPFMREEKSIAGNFPTLREEKNRRFFLPALCGKISLHRGIFPQSAGKELPLPLQLQIKNYE